MNKQWGNWRYRSKYERSAGVHFEIGERNRETLMSGIGGPKIGGGLELLLQLENDTVNINRRRRQRWDRQHEVGRRRTGLALACIDKAYKQASTNHTCITEKDKKQVLPESFQWPIVYRTRKTYYWSQNHTLLFNAVTIAFVSRIHSRSMHGNWNVALIRWSQYVIETWPIALH